MSGQSQALKEIAEAYLPGWRVVEAEKEVETTPADWAPNLAKLRDPDFHFPTDRYREAAAAGASEGSSGFVTLEAPNAERKVILIENGIVVAQAD